MPALKTALLFVCLFNTVARADDTITGVVHNQTTGKPAAGDTVLLLRLGEGMEEESQAKTDAQGAFTLRPTVANAQRVLRVLHQGVNYDQTVTGAAPLDLTVFDAVRKVKGMSGDIGIVQMESAGGALKVTEMYAITNASAPPVTQAGAHNYDFSLPEKTALDFVQVKRRKGIWGNLQPAAAEGQIGRYSIDYPIRPGDTLFKIAYRLPDKGPTTFRLKLAYPINKLAVMLPPSLSFRASKPGTFELIGHANGFMIENAVARPVVGQIPDFEISGTAAPQPPTSVAKAAAPQISAIPAVGSNLGGTATSAPTKAPALSSPALWLVLAGAAAAVSAGLFSFWGDPAKTGPTTKKNTNPPPPPVFEALKEELFQLERDRLRG